MLVRGAGRNDLRQILAVCVFVSWNVARKEGFALPLSFARRSPAVSNQLPGCRSWTWSIECRATFRQIFRRKLGSSPEKDGPSDRNAGFRNHDVACVCRRSQLHWRDVNLWHMLVLWNEAEAELRRYSGIGSHGGVLEVGNLNLQMSPTLLQQIHDTTSCLCWTRSPPVPKITTGEPQPLPRAATGCAAPNSPDSQHASQPSPPRNIFPPQAYSYSPPSSAKSGVSPLSSRHSSLMPRIYVAPKTGQTGSLSKRRPFGKSASPVIDHKLSSPNGRPRPGCAAAAGTPHAASPRLRVYMTGLCSPRSSAASSASMSPRDHVTLRSPRSTWVIRAKGSDSGASPRSQSHRCLSEGTSASPSTLSPRSPRVLAESPGRSPTCSRLPWMPAPFDPAAVCQSMRRGSSSQRRMRVSLSSSPTRRLSRTLPGCTDAIIWSDASHAIGKLSNNRKSSGGPLSCKTIALACIFCRRASAADQIFGIGLRRRSSRTLSLMPDAGQPPQGSQGSLAGDGGDDTISIWVCAPLVQEGPKQLLQLR